MTDLDGMVFVVTGGGLGEELARDLAAAGARLAAGLPDGTETAAKMAATAGRFGRVDGLVVIAGAETGSFDTGWSGAAESLRRAGREVAAAVPTMRAQAGGGSIALVVAGGQTAGAALSGLTASAAGELRPAGIRVNTIVAGEGPAGLVPLLLFLASPEAAGVTGHLFGVAGSRIFEHRLQPTVGVESADEGWTAGRISRQLAQIVRPEAVPSADPEVAGRVERGLAGLPGRFDPEAVAGWNGALLFRVAGVGDYSLTVEDGAAVAATGACPRPSCVVEAGPAAFLDLIDGRIDAAAAVRDGLISATRPAELDLFQTAFAGRDGGRAATAHEARTAASPGSEWFFRFAHKLALELPGPVLFKLGREEFHLRPGVNHLIWGRGRPAGEPVATVAGSPDALMRAVAGQGPPGTGVTTDRPELWKALEQAIGNAGIAGRIEKALAGCPTLPPGKTEQVLRLGPFTVPAAEVEAFAAAIGRPLTAGHTAPPTLPVRYFHDHHRLVLGDPELNINLLRLLFAGQQMHFVRPVMAGDRLSVETRIDGLEEKDTGHVLSVSQLLHDGACPVCESRSSFFVRGGWKGPVRSDGAESGPAAEWELTGRVGVDPDQSRRYAAASGDDNPIHTDDEVARMAGLPGIILHGLCSLALTGNVLSDLLAGGDWSRLKRIACRFSAPVFPGETLLVRARREAGAGVSHAFSTVNESGIEVISQGRALIV